MTSTASLRRPAVAMAAVALALGACAGVPSPRGRPPSSTSQTAMSPPTSMTLAPARPSSTVTTALGSGPGSHGLEATDRLERRHRLAQVLPQRSAHYSIDFTVGDTGQLHLRVTLLAVLNDAGDLAAYQAQLRQYKAEALEFIRAQGDDPASYTVAYLPPEAAAL